MEDWVLEFAINMAGRFPVIGTILMLLGILVVLAQGIILITPKKDDDAWLDNILKGWPGVIIRILERFAPFQKKL